MSAYKSIRTMAVPMMTSRFVQTLNGFVTMLVLAQLGSAVLAASLTIATVRIVILLMAMSPLFVLGAIVGRQMNTDAQKKLPALLAQSWWLSLALSLPAMLVMWFIAPLLQWTHQPAAIIPIVTTFFHVQCWMMPAILIAVVGQQFLAAMKQQHWVTGLSVLSFLLNSVLCYVLVMSPWGVPSFGVAGAAWAGFLSAWVAAIVTVYFVLQKLPVALAWRDFSLKTMHWVRLILKVGLPVCLQFSSEMLVLLVIAVMVGWFGEIAMSASQISNQYMLFAIVPIFGLSEASSIRVGHAFADRKLTELGALGQAGLLLSIVATVTLGLIFLLFHRPLAELFMAQGLVHREAIYWLAMTLLLIRVISMFFDGLADVSSGLLRGLFDTRFPMWIGLFFNWVVMLPLAYVLSIYFHEGVIGICLAGLFSRMIEGAILLRRWYYMKQRSHLIEAG